MRRSKMAMWIETRDFLQGREKILDLLIVLIRARYDQVTVKPRIWNTSWSAANVFQNRGWFQNQGDLWSKNFGPQQKVAFQNWGFQIRGFTVCKQNRCQTWETFMLIWQKVQNCKVRFLKNLDSSFLADHSIHLWLSSPKPDRSFFA